MMNNWVIWKLCVWSVWKSHFSAKLLFELLQALQSIASVVIWDSVLSSLICVCIFFVWATQTGNSHSNFEHFAIPSHSQAKTWNEWTTKMEKWQTYTNLLKFCQCLMIVFTINRINWLKTSVKLSDTNWQRCGAVTDGRCTHSLI